VKLTSLGGTWALIFLALYAVFAAFAAVAVYRDAEQRSDLFLGLHPAWWGGVTFITGAITGVAAYWLIHYSSLRRFDNNADNAS
jgi:uncharacterized membrane protein